MKLSGDDRNGRHVDNNVGKQKYEKYGNYDAQNGIDGMPPRSRAVADAGQLERKRQRSKKKRVRRTVSTVLFVIIALGVGIYVFYKAGLRPPNVNGSREVASSGTGTTIDDRDGDKFTFVLLGTDAISNSTDTIMVAMLDTNAHKLNVVSIPRDTLVNVSWSVKKANTFYSNGGTDEVIKGLSDILGYNVDFYAVVNLEAFSKLIDAIGGVDYDIPVKMDYDDPAQNLSIHFKPGMQHLNGTQALEVMRFRKGYANQDIGRIGTQQDFMKTVASQLLAKKNAINITTLINVFVNYVKTDLTVGNLAWLAKEFYKIDSSNINFYTLPGNYADSIYQGGSWISYVTIDVNDWLKMLNDNLNPFTDPIEKDDLSILTRNSGGSLYSTNGVYAGNKSWGSTASSSGSSSSSSSSKSSGSASSGNSSSSTKQGSSGTTKSGGSGSSTKSGSTGSTKSGGSNSSGSTKSGNSSASGNTESTGSGSSAASDDSGTTKSGGSSGSGSTETTKSGSKETDAKKSNTSITPESGTPGTQKSAGSEKTVVSDAGEYASVSGSAA